MKKCFRTLFDQREPLRSEAKFVENASFDDA
jgi:hypothetical protein